MNPTVFSVHIYTPDKLGGPLYARLRKLHGIDSSVDAYALMLCFHGGETMTAFMHDIEAAEHIADDLAQHSTVRLDQAHIDDTGRAGWPDEWCDTCFDRWQNE